jgi:xylan 1,4-beta-xylosidase
MNLSRRLFPIALLVVCCGGLHAEEVRFEVNAGEVLGPNTRFWQAAGHDYLFHYVNTPIGRAFLDRAEAKQSLRYFRTHFTFDTTESDDVPGVAVGGDVVKRGPTGELIYDFSKVNQTYREYVQRGMKPIVEFGFFPDGFARDFGPLRADNREGQHEREAVPKDWDQWEALQRAFMENLEREFGPEELRTWYFEVWNEPDQWPLAHIDVFFRLYDVFSHVVKSFDSDYRVGGPGAYTPAFLDRFLQHVEHGTNYVTGATGSPLDFVSYHLYGISGSWLKQSPALFPRVDFFQREMRWLDRIVQAYPKAAAAEFHLNEWGLASRFRRSVDRFPELEFRNDHRSPLFLVKLVDQLYALGDHGILKTDLLLYWGFTWEAERGRMFHGNRELLTGAEVAKPILAGFEMLARLRESRLAVAKGPRPGGRFGLLPTREGDHLAMIAYNFEESDDDFSREDRLVVELTHLGHAAQLEWRATVLSSEQNNSYARWQDAGRPAADSISPAEAAAFSRLEVTASGVVPVNDGKAILPVSLPRHSMVLLEVNLRE